MPHSALIPRFFENSTNGRFKIEIGLFGLALLAAGIAAPAHAEMACPPADPAARLATAAPLNQTAEMRAWARETVPARGTEIMRLRRLHAALLARDCSSDSGDAFAFRFVALAREVGIPAYFVLVAPPPGRSEDGSLHPVASHLAAGFGLDGRVVVFDATAISRPRHWRLHLLTDRRAVAVVNRDAGLEFLRNSEDQAAIERLETAVRLAPEMASAWSTLGLALRRVGQQNEALDAYERSIALALSR